MKAKIRTNGFIFPNLNFGIKGDCFDVVDNVLIIYSWNGIYQFTDYFEHVPSLHIWVPPQWGTYDGPWNGLGCIHELNFNISEVKDIVSSLTDDMALTEVEYIILRMKYRLETRHTINPQFMSCISEYEILLDQRESIDEEINKLHAKLITDQRCT